MPSVASNPLRRKSSRLSKGEELVNDPESSNASEDFENSSQTDSPSSSSSSSESESDENDVYVPGKPSQTRKLSTRITKRRRQVKIKAQPLNYKDLEENLKENYLFESLEDPEISVIELANDWLDTYRDTQDIALRDLVNLVLRSCGCLSLVEAHDVYNIETASQTVQEVQTKFKAQKVHEFPFGSKSQHIKHFSKAVLEFFKQVVILANEKNMLINSDSNEEEEPDFLETILVWLSLFSACDIRLLRYVATMILLVIETQVCECLIRITNNLQKNQKNLAKEHEKLVKINTSARQNSAAKSRETKRIEKHCATITKNIEFYDSHKTLFKEYISDIFESVFVHRFKDVDPKIRMECVKSLYSWIDIYPEYFFDNRCLKFFGLLFYDMSNPVRLEVLKSLLKLYKSTSGSVVSGLKQFTEMHKSDIINTLLYEPDRSIKVHCLNILVEINRIGYLEKNEIMRINSLIFDTLKNDSDDVSNEFDKVPQVERELKDNEKLLSELVKFIDIVETEKSSETKERFKLAIEKFTVSSLDIKSIIKFKSLIDIFVNSKSYRKDLDSGITNDEEHEFDVKINPNVVSFSKDVCNIDLNSTKIPDNSLMYFNEIIRLGVLLYKNFPSYKDSWMFLLDYLTADISSLNVEDSDAETDFKQLLESNESEHYFLLCLLYGMLQGSSQESVNYETKGVTGIKNVVVEESKKSPQLYLVSKLPSLVEQFESSAPNFKIVLDLLFNFVITDDSKKQNLPLLTSDEVVIQNLIKKLISVFRNLRTTNSEEQDNIDSEVIILKQEFLKLFQILKTGLDKNEFSSTNKLLIQNLMIELSLELSNTLTGDKESLNIISSQSVLSKVYLILEKFNIVGQSFNITSYIDKNVVDMIGEKVMSPLTFYDFEAAESLEFEENYERFSNQFNCQFNTLLQFYLILTGWKLSTVYSFARGESIFAIDKGYTDLESSAKDYFSLCSSMKIQVTDFVIGGNAGLTDLIFRLRTSASMFLCDLIIAFKSLRLTTADNPRLNSRFSDYRTFVDTDLDLPVENQVVESLKESFLHLESNVAKLHDVQLERNDDEDVTFGFVKVRELKELQKEKLLAKNESLLVAFVLKLFDLVNFRLLDKKILQRLHLNEEKLGPIYGQVLKDLKAKEDAAIAAANRKKHSLAVQEEPDTEMAAGEIHKPEEIEEVEELEEMEVDEHLATENNGEQNKFELFNIESANIDQTQDHENYDITKRSNKAPTVLLTATEDENTETPKGTASQVEDVETPSTVNSSSKVSKSSSKKRKSVNADDFEMISDSDSEISSKRRRTGSRRSSRKF